jgi:hypothetical protein
MGRVAPHATGIAHRKAHEHAGQSREGRFALDAAVNLVNQQQQLAGRLFCQGSEALFQLQHAFILSAGVQFKLFCEGEIRYVEDPRFSEYLRGAAWKDG